MPTNIKSPAYGSTHDVETFGFLRSTVGMRSIRVRPSIWPHTDIFSWEFDNLTRTNVDNLIVFLKTNAGKTVQVQEKEGRIWKGMFLEDITISRRFMEGRTQSCADKSIYSVTLKFDGDLV